MNNLNFKTAVLAIFLGIGVGTVLHAQQEAPKTESKKKIVIIKKTVDENGNKVVEKIIKEGDEIEEFHLEEIEGIGEIDILVNEDNGEEKEIRIISTGDVSGVEKVEDIRIDISDEFENVEIDIDETEGQNSFRFEVKTDGESPKIIQWQGDGEMPEEVKEKMEKLKLELKNHNRLSLTQSDFMHGRAFATSPKKGPFLGVIAAAAEEGQSGAYIGQISEGSGAEKAGIKAGDIITDIDGEPVTSFSDLSSIITKHEIGDKLNIAYVRDGNVQTTTATLGERKRGSTSYSVWHDHDDFTITKNLPCLLIGVYTETVKSTPNERGVRVTSIIENTPAEDIKMQSGDIIVALNGVEINEHNALTIERDRHAPGDKVSIVYLRDGREVADEITFRTCEEEREKEYVIRRGPHSKREVKTKKRIYIIKSKKKEKEVETETEPVLEVTPVEETAEAELREAPRVSQKLNLKAFRAFPNPTTEAVNIRFEGDIAPTTLNVTDIAGRVIYREEMDDFPGWYSKRIDLSEAAPGALLITVEQDGKIFTEKIIRQDVNRP